MSAAQHTPGDDADRFRKPAPIIDLTPEVVAQLRVLVDKVQQFARLSGLPWRRGADSGKPLLYGGEEGRGALMAYGTIGSWSEFDLAIAAVNALPAFLALHEAGLRAPSSPVVLPELMEAAAAVMAIRPANWDDDDDPEQVAAWRKLDEAIAKARGQ